MLSESKELFRSPTNPSSQKRRKRTLPTSGITPIVSESFPLFTDVFLIAHLEVPYSAPAREILRLLRSKAPDTELAPYLDDIESTASSLSVPHPLVPSTDAYVTAICFLGSKSLSHVLSCIERCKERLLGIGAKSETARRQIISSVMAYWAEKPGVGVNMVDKLLNYTILTPMTVIEWALIENIGRGEILTQAHIYEMVASTMHKVTNRVRQIVTARNQPDLPSDQVAVLDETLTKERAEMQNLFAVVEGALAGVADGSVDAMAESRNQDEEGEAMLRGWGGRWLRVFRRKMAVEEAWVGEIMAAAALAAEGKGDVDSAKANGETENGVNGNGIAHAAEEDLVL